MGRERRSSGTANAAIRTCRCSAHVIAGYGAKPVIKKLVSGGQTGADVGALQGAKIFGLPTGGWMPLGFLTENGPRADYAVLYGMKEHSSARYPPRTWSNVRDADVTVWFGTTDSAGYRCTKTAAVAYTKRFVENPSGDALVDIFLAYDVVNVAGNRASKNPKIYSLVLRIVLDSLRRVKEAVCPHETT